MEGIVGGLIWAIFKLLGFSVSKECQNFWSDICGILAGKEVKNHRRRDKYVC
jgi:hypothetical protein